MAKFKFKGFTLIEVLIVILVIGILAAAMMYASDELVTTAKATEILNNLQICKKAVLSFYADNPDLFEYGDMKSGIQNYLWHNKNQIALITKYFDGRNIVFQDHHSVRGVNMPFKTEGTYGVADASEEGKKRINDMHTRYSWFVGYRFRENEGRVKEKVRARAKSLGLYFAGHIPNFNKSASYDVEVDGEKVVRNYTDGDDVVWMRVFGEYTEESRYR